MRAEKTKKNDSRSAHRERRDFLRRFLGLGLFSFAWGANFREKSRPDIHPHRRADFWKKENRLAG